ncbi:MAG TPA: hypothetical protein PLI13_12950, partial [Paracoccus sp. (in: a-proteobacteria)]|nr:hypothetical protein [Paracoccus sp. (in: a-proteobacteria)]
MIARAGRKSKASDLPPARSLTHGKICGSIPYMGCYSIIWEETMKALKGALAVALLSGPAFA